MPDTPSRTEARRTISAHTIPIAVVCGLLLATHLYLRRSGSKWEEGLDAVALSLALVGLSPWIARVLDTTKFGGVEFKFRQIRDEVHDQRGEIDTLKFLIGHFLGRNELQLLMKLASPEPYEVDVTVFPNEFQAELRHLRGLGFIDNHEGRGIRDMYQHDPNTNKRDVREHFYVTKSGREFLKLRDTVAREAASARL
jgi:hypothetical protein